MPRGRPREFDADDALERITAAFWTRGYGATSVANLEHETGLGRTSLYAAFGDKDAMFTRALDAYWTARMARTREVLLAGGRGADAVAALFRKVVANLSDSTQPRGCLRVNSALEIGCMPDDAEEAVRRMQAELEAAILDRLADGASPRGAAPDAARFVVTTINGLAVSARVGTRRAELEATAGLAHAAVAAALSGRRAAPRSVR